MSDTNEFKIENVRALEPHEFPFLRTLGSDTKILSIIAADGREVASLMPNGDLECSDWGHVREQARLCHEAVTTGISGGCCYCAIIWAARNPGVKP